MTRPDRKDACYATFVAVLMWTMLSLTAHAAAVPPHLASMAAKLFDAAKADLEAQLDVPDRRDEARRALNALKQTRIRTFAKTPFALSPDMTAIGDALKIDPATPKGAMRLADLLAMNEAEARAALAKTIDDPARISEITGMLSALRAANNFATRHVFDVSDSERVSFNWLPEAQKFAIQISDDGSGDGPAYETSLSGTTRLIPNPETGALDLVLTPDETPIRLLTAAGLGRIAASLFAEWVETDGTRWIISKAQGTDDSAGTIRRSPAAIRADIDAAQTRINAIKSNKEFVWTDPTTEEIIRQTRFSRLPDPWVYGGETFVEADAEVQIQKLEERMAALQVEASGANLPPAQRFDPVDYSRSRAAGAQPINIRVIEAGGRSYTWDEATFDGRHVRARRTLKVPEDVTNENIPQVIKQELVASWSPPNWLDLVAGIDPASAELSLEGNRWSMHATWTNTLGMQLEVKSIHTPFPTAKSMTLPGSKSLMAFGAADTATP